jgi:tetratricopeptide (TPR) repeat protein
METKHDESDLLLGPARPLLRPKSARRWIASMVLNVVGYMAAALVWRHLAVSPWGGVVFTAGSSASTSLAEHLLGPMGMFAQPWMMLVIGLLLGVLAVAPILMAVMYQLLLALAFSVALAILGGAPWLALAVGAGCLVAARTKLRREYPFLAVLLGLLPVGVYMILTRLGIDGATLLPLQRWLLAVPMVLALLVAMVLASGAVLLARLTRFQPGVVWPVLLVGLIAPVAIFLTQIGMDELAYAQLTDSLGSGDQLLPAQPLSPEGTFPEVPSHRVDREAAQTRRLTERCQTLRAACGRFLTRYPNSRRAPSVMWILAQSDSLQRDQRDLNTEVIRYTVAHPSLDAESTCRRLVEQYPESDQAALALWQLGQFAIRHTLTQKTPTQASIDQACSLLHQAEEKLREIVSTRRDEPHSSNPFPALANHPRRKDDYEKALFAVEKMNWLIEKNDVREDPACRRALAELLSINPYAPDGRVRFRQLAQGSTFAKTKMADNLRMAYALELTDRSDRAEAMLALAEDELQDAAIEANYELGYLALRFAKMSQIPQAPEAYFTIVVAAPENPWQSRAAKHLAWLKSVAPASSADAPYSPKAPR